MKRVFLLLETGILLLALTACIPTGEQSSTATVSSQSVSSSQASVSSSLPQESSSQTADISIPAPEKEQKDLLAALWERLHAGECDEKCWMSCMNLICFEQKDDGFVFYPGAAESDVGGVRAVSRIEQEDEDTYRVYFSVKQSSVYTYYFDQDVEPYLYLHFEGEELSMTEVYPAYVQVGEVGTENYEYECRAPSDAERKNGEDRMRELSETETYYPASGAENECLVYTYQDLKSHVDNA